MLVALKAEMAVEEEVQIKQKSRLRENIEAILVAVLLALFIRTFIVQAFKIPSGSMKQTLQIGDHILVNKFIYGVKLPFLQKVIIPLKTPQRGDIIVFKFPVEPEKDFIKRVVGIPGDTIEGRDKQIFVNNQPVVEQYAIQTDPHIYPKGMQTRDNFGPITVPENALFVMGDNRDQSFDSRFWGFVDMKVVSGKAFMIYWSWDKDNFGVRWDRIFQILK
jgi:signal peptidase I